MIQPPDTGMGGPGGLKDTLDVAAGGMAFGSLFNLLPNIAAALAAIWTLIRIYEWARIRIFKKEDNKDGH